MISSKIIAALVLILVLLGGLFYWYWSYSQTQIANLNQSVATLKLSVQVQNDTITAQQAQAKEQAAATTKLQKDLADANATTNKLQILFRSHNLQQLANQDSLKLEAAINNATKKAFVDIETVTGGGPKTNVLSTIKTP